MTRLESKVALVSGSARGIGAAKIRVNFVHPDFVRTPMTAGAFQPGFDHVAMHRGAEPGEIAAMIVFLASDESSFSTGAEFVADGGETAGNATFLAA